MRSKIAVVMGGYSSEYQISLKSGQVVCEHLNKEKYDVYPIHILKDKWVYKAEDQSEIPVDKADFSISVQGEMIKFDAVFNAIHGHPGENGVLPAYFDLLGIKHTSDSFYKMALTFNKRDCLSVLTPFDIPHAVSYFLNKGDKIHTDEIVEKVGLPCFVKANASGSSFGVTKVYNEADLKKAIDYAFTEDDAVLIETFMEGREFSIGVITYKGKVSVLPITEIVSENDFFDYEAKYLGKSKEITPADITPAMEKSLAEMAERTYNALGMKGFTRSEYIWYHNQPHLLEVNTIPGLTAQSILPQQAVYAGISLEELFGDAVERALHH